MTRINYLACWRDLLADHRPIEQDGFVATPNGLSLREDGSETGYLRSARDRGPLVIEGMHAAPAIALNFEARAGGVTKYGSDDGKVAVHLEIGARGTGAFYYAFKITPARALVATTIAVDFTIAFGGDPDFTWVPILCPEPGLVIPDHVFRSPAIIYKSGKHAFALVPDLDLFNADRRRPQFMYLEVRPNSTPKSPVKHDPPFASRVMIGFGQYQAIGHVFFKRDTRRHVSIRSGETAILAFHVLAFNGSTTDQILQRVNSFLWEEYGSKMLRKTLAPQVLPYDVNVKEGFLAIFDRHKLWQDFKVDGHDCGGSWQASWMGAKKMPVKHADPATFSLDKQLGKNMTRLVNRDSLLSKIVMYLSSKPFWIQAFDVLSRTFPVVARSAEVWNNAWFLNVRTAYAFAHFGQAWDDPVLVDKARRALELVLSLPRERGLFPGIVMPGKPGVEGYATVKGTRGFHYVDEYSIVDNSLTMYWALKLYQDHFPDDRILARAKNLLDLVASIQRGNGEIPAYLSVKAQGDRCSIVPNEYLAGSASSAAPLMLLCEYCKLVPGKAVLDVARKIAAYLVSDILSTNKWHDFEPFYSCTNLPTSFHDARTGVHVMNALCIYWCAEGMKELYKLTSDPRYLEAGEHAMAILSLFQQVWRMPHLSINAFGGFGSQNADAELNDARQGLFVRVYMEYYLLTRKREYMDRGIAALRACWATQLLPELASECPGAIKGIGTVNGIDKGMVGENYGHSGHDLRVPGYVMPDWGIGTAASAVAYVKRHFGDIFIDFKERAAWGIDGIMVHHASFEGNKVSIKCTIIDKKHQAIIKACDAPGGIVIVAINGVERARMHGGAGMASELVELSLAVGN